MGRAGKTNGARGDLGGGGNGKRRVRGGWSGKGGGDRGYVAPRKTGWEGGREGGGGKREGEGKRGGREGGEGGRRGGRGGRVG